MTITRSTFPALLWPGIQAIFGQNYEKLDKEYTRIFDVRTSKKAYEKVTEATGLGLAAVKSEGGSILYDNPSPGATSVFTHVTYGLGYIITREAEEDNQYQEVAEGNAASLPWSMLTTKEIVHANILNRGFDTSYVGGDGKPLFSATHPTANGTFSNIITAADLSEASLEDGLSTLMAATNSAGLPIALRAVRLIVSPGQIFNATRIQPLPDRHRRLVSPDQCSQRSDLVSAPGSGASRRQRFRHRESQAQGDGALFRRLGRSSRHLRKHWSIVDGHQQLQ
jgi:hypothetical protein